VEKIKCFSNLQVYLPQTVELERGSKQYSDFDPMWIKSLENLNQTDRQTVRWMDKQNEGKLIVPFSTASRGDLNRALFLLVLVWTAS
jgi:hypothetical protein